MIPCIQQADNFFVNVTTRTPICQFPAWNNMHLLAVAILPILAFAKSLPELAKSTRSGVITLSDSNYHKIAAFPRNHTAIVVLTALGSQFNCDICRLFDPEYKILARSWQKSHGGQPNNVYFSQLDLNDGKQTFRSLGVQHAPNLWIYTPREADPIKYVFQPQPNAEIVAKFISSVIGDSVPIIRPFNYNKLFAAILFIIATGSVIKLLWNPFMNLVGNRNFWAILSLFSIILFISGQMFNQIRGTPYLVSNGKGGVDYVADGFANQLGLESQMVCVIYILLGLAVAKLTFDVPKKRTEKEQNLLVFLWLGVIWVVNSALLDLFHLKNTGYPFRLLF
ncbi:Dolichyl-diphosphooligosaccharide--protein glycosyltransferase subunit 3 [Neolecta irregularis DAH-3]|uniref:Dolichyl-diphosphooligosaccharide--protein glycosyltransferase subunit 3 n=1 Tax=Neolecta irregularis (strain DAH-3) TaxID=1198029 RepID=A0A1U7LI57_NEOID|nr:Dolichyl-diphosphooligosaccharide--protein glycosyltransferase subunit 3 [Neolecta irregularis DAH-3]|eukprot:OLL22232.1 Dolichyl-diphosphooligosaccharide--protein glycosyltransferase subunit 3 [Neolecta irregularis DAH-3]